MSMKNWLAKRAFIVHFFSVLPVHIMFIIIRGEKLKANYSRRFFCLKGFKPWGCGMNTAKPDSEG
jgi:hypothetical protein